MVYKLTLDGGLLREAELQPAVATLKKWEAEGKVELFESDRAKAPAEGTGWPGASAPPPRPQGMRQRAPKRATNGPSFQSISHVLFPSRDSQRLNMTEINEVAHLLCHKASGNSIFVTQNLRDFIDGGKREHLQSSFQILVLTPDEAVEVIKAADALAEKGTTTTLGELAPKRSDR